MYQTIRIIIADDHELMRKSLPILLKKQDEIEIVDDAENGKELLEKVRQHEPDVVVTDIQMPIMDGIKATKKIKEEFPDVKVLALTMFNEDHLIVDMLEAGFFQSAPCSLMASLLMILMLISAMMKEEIIRK